MEVIVACEKQNMSANEKGCTMVAMNWEMFLI